MEEVVWVAIYISICDWALFVKHCIKLIECETLQKSLCNSGQVQVHKLMTSLVFAQLNDVEICNVCLCFLSSKIYLNNKTKYTEYTSLNTHLKEKVMLYGVQQHVFLIILVYIQKTYIQAAKNLSFCTIDLISAL